jgi:MoaA/NifB/PqqE/SkfB family radical SAM enzyme
MDKYKIDSHKLNYHPERVSDWRKGVDIYPIYMEMSPIGACNHRCVFCGLDFMGYQNRKLELPMLKKLMPELGRLGLKSIMHGGEGEPLLHKDFPEIIELTSSSGIDPALTSNGVLLKKDIADVIIRGCKWIKISINAGKADTYAKIHRTKASDFEKVISNMQNAVGVRKRHGYSCTLGMQIILLPENRDEIIELAKTAKDIGLDYLVVKPYSQHTQSNTKIYKDITYKKDLELAESLKKLNGDSFSVIFRLNTMKKWDESARSYKCCLALPFWSYIDAGGGVWGCSMYLNDERFLYGNVYKNSFKQIWTGRKRMESMKMMKNSFDISSCRINCRMDEINRYLWELQNPNEHVNFI